MSDIVTIGETMGLLRGPLGEQLEMAATLDLGIGGAESNVAICSARLGASVTWVGRVGNDALGRRVLREIRGEGVVVRATVDSRAPTGLMLKERRSAHHTRVTYYRGESAGSRIGVTEVEEAGSIIRSSKLLHVTGITPGLSRTSHDAVFAAVEIARTAGVPVSFDVNHRTGVWGDRDAEAVYRRLAEQSTVFFGGVEEAAMIVPSTSKSDLAAAIAALGPTEVILKDGARGASALIDGEAFDVPAVAVPVVDTVGAGDAFVAGYLVGRGRGLSGSARMQMAAHVAAFVCMSAGDWEGAPTMSDLNDSPGTDWVTR